MIGELHVLLHGADCFNIGEVERIALDVLELAVVFEVHPWGVTLGDVDCLFWHVLEVDDARFDDLLGLD